MEDHAPVSDSNEYEEPCTSTSKDFCNNSSTFGALKNCSAIVSVVDGHLHTRFVPYEQINLRKYDDMSTIFNNSNNNFDATNNRHQQRQSSLFDFATIGMRTTSTINRPSANNSPGSPLLIGAGGSSSSGGGASYACGSLVPLRGPPPIHAPPQPPNCPPPKRRPQQNRHIQKRHRKCLSCCHRFGRWPAILFLLLPAMLLLLSLCLLLVWLTLLREDFSFSSQKFINDRFIQNKNTRISFLSNAQQQPQQHSSTSSAHQLPNIPTQLILNNPIIIQLPPYHLLFTQIYIPQNSLLRLNLTIGPSSRIIIFARQTIRPTIGQFDWQKIFFGENLHLEKEMTFNEGEKEGKIGQKKKLGFVNHFLQAGIWHFGLLNDKTESEYIELIAQLEEPSNIEQHKNNKIISQCHHSNCFGKGECIEGRCVCHPGYSGLFCEETSCPVLCSGQGVFNKGRCLCHQGFRGVECEETIEWCDNKDCGIGGQCQPDGTCLCLPGWIGKYCEQNLQQIKEEIEQIQIENDEENKKEDCLLDCSGHGNCILINNQNEEGKKMKECNCLSGWTGINCQIELCPKNCSSNGQCMLSVKKVNGEGWWHCECNYGYYGEYCQFRAESNCEDGEDNDEDGLTDCEDSTECCSHNSCLSNSLCLGSFVSTELLLKLSFINETKQQENTTLEQIPFFERVRFLFDSADLSVQRYADIRLLDPKLLSVLRGRILSIKGGPLAGVRVSVADHPQQGFSLSRSFSPASSATALEGSQSSFENYIDTSIGEFELAVNGGAAVILQFVRQPFGRVVRTFFVPSNQILDVGNVWMDSIEEKDGGENEASTTL
uniref:EGF-like domain-containing protein n=1 Tax=Meloidogyne enterolobii TaxID=390850 RepID=A0A6V7TNP3_MELEN|nr:unnamed protein product [Meloidogyne enterolobii]